jgi:hypothetical protein
VLRNRDERGCAAERASEQGSRGDLVVYGASGSGIRVAEERPARTSIGAQEMPMKVKSFAAMSALATITSLVLGCSAGVDAPKGDEEKVSSEQSAFGGPTMAYDGVSCDKLTMAGDGFTPGGTVQVWIHKAGGAWDAPQTFMVPVMSSCSGVGRFRHCLPNLAGAVQLSPYGEGRYDEVYALDVQTGATDVYYFTQPVFLNLC